MSNKYFTVRFILLVLGFSALTVLTTAPLSTFLLRESKTPPGENFGDEPFTSDRAAQQKNIAQLYGKLPLTFEANGGRTDAQVNFLARGAGYSLFLKPDGAVFVFTNRAGDETKNVKEPAPQPAEDSKKPEDSPPAAVLRMNLVGANQKAESEGAGEQSGKINYFSGGDETKWQTGVSTYERINYRQVYAGIDVTYYGNQRRLEYDFVVAPQADYRQIKLKFDGAEKIEIEPASGELLLQTALGEIRQHKPVIYQETDGQRREIAGNYVRRGEAEIGFEIGEYDRSRELVIDPILSYSTFLGGSVMDEATAIAVDSAGNAYITGATGSFNFPLVNPIQNACGCGESQFGNYRTDAFVTKINAAGTAIVYSTYLGGTGIDDGSGITVDSAGNVYLTGGTTSSNFPTVNPIQSARVGSADGFAAKINAAGNALVYSTYLGGNGIDSGFAIATDSTGNAYISGLTNSTNFPTVNPLQATCGCVANTITNDVFVTKINAAGTALVYSTYLGGTLNESGSAIAVDAAGNAYVGGRTESTNFPTANAIQNTFGGGFSDGFTTKINSSGTAFVYSTYLGGNNSDDVNGITADSSGNGYLTGSTYSANFPIVNPLQNTLHGFGDAFVTKINASGTALFFSTYLGGDGDETGYGIGLDGAGNIYVGGYTDSNDFPSLNPLQDIVTKTPYGFLSKLNNSGSAFVYSTPLVGGCGYDQLNALAVDSTGNVYLTGFTRSSNFPTVNAVQSAHGGGFTDGFVAKISDSGTSSPLRRNPINANFDGDCKADFAVFRPNPDPDFADFRILKSSDNALLGYSWGLLGDKLAPADYDGDGITDVAIWREPEANFYIHKSSDAGLRLENFGLPGDVLTVGDWDGDGRADVSVYRQGAQQSYFYYRGSLNNPSGNITYIPWGIAGDKPLGGDFDGDGKTDAAVFRPSNGVWYIRQSSNGSVRYENWGLSSDTFVPADYDGDRKTDLAVYRSGVWYIKQSSNNQPRYEYFGISTDKPVPADYDGDGRADVAVFRNGQWYLSQSTEGYKVIDFGSSGDAALPNAYINP